MCERAVIVVAIACGCVVAPRPIDTAALVGARGLVEARRDLQIRILANPRDVAPRLALAELDDNARPSSAIAQLEVVEGLGGPLGARWHRGDRDRLARLLVARAAARATRGAASGLADLDHARKLGASPPASDIARARLAAAMAKLRHVDAEERARGRALLVEVGDASIAAGARPNAAPDQRGLFGAWLWSIGARREAYEQLAAWYAARGTDAGMDLHGAYERALAWWVPPELPSAPVVVDAPAGAPPLVVTAIAGPPRAAGAARYVRVRVAGAPPEHALARVAAAYARDPAIAERLGREVVDAALDAAPAHAALGALYDALGDPGRARGEWQAAVDASDEPSFVRGLAEAAARGRDGDAALVVATGAAAASGDPAETWISVARALDRSGRHVEALVAASSAIDLAGAGAIARALDVAISASAALGRDDQAAQLRLRRARFPAPDPELAQALSAHAARPTAATIARLWVASRANPRDVATRGALIWSISTDDPRYATLVAELVAMAGEGDLDAAAAVR
jgi:hypothetical protein